MDVERFDEENEVPSSGILEDASSDIVEDTSPNIQGDAPSDDVEDTSPDTLEDASSDDVDDGLGPLPKLELTSEDIMARFGLDQVVTEEASETPLDPELFESVEEEEEEIGSILPDPFAEGDGISEADPRAWFIIHCYSGYEHKVRYNLEQRIESMGMQEFIFQVVVPTVEEIEIKDGKRRTVERCLYPGYIMVQMTLTDDSWYVVRNTPSVTGFVGMGNTPTPLRPEAVQGILRRMEASAPQVRATFKPGQKVRIIEGPFADFIGTVDDIDEERTKVRVLVSFFGRETPVELDFLQVEKA